MADYPLPKFHFRVSWGAAKMGFTEVSGMGIKIVLNELRGTDSKELRKRKMPGLQKYSNITLKRGAFKSDIDYHAWLQDVVSEKANRQDMVISLHNEKNEEVAAWKVARCFPTKITATDLKSDGNEVAIESMEIAHEGLTLIRRDDD